MRTSFAGTRGSIVAPTGQGKHGRAGTEASLAFPIIKGMNHHRYVLLAVVGLACTASVGAGETSPLEGRLRRLEKEIAAVRELPFKFPVKAKVISRAPDVLKSIQGYYSTQDKTLYLYDDVSGAYEAGVLIH